MDWFRFRKKFDQGELDAIRLWLDRYTALALRNWPLVAGKDGLPDTDASRGDVTREERLAVSEAAAGLVGPGAFANAKRAFPNEVGLKGPPTEPVTAAWFSLAYLPVNVYVDDVRAFLRTNVLYSARRVLEQVRARNFDYHMAELQEFVAKDARRFQLMMEKTYLEPAGKVLRLHEEFAAMRVDLPALAARWSPRGSGGPSAT